MGEAETLALALLGREGCGLLDCEALGSGVSELATVGEAPSGAEGRGDCEGEAETLALALLGGEGCGLLDCEALGSGV